MNKRLVEEDLDTYKVILPPVEKLMGRSSLCCCYTGLNCSAEHKPCGCQTAVRSCCLDLSSGYHVMSASADKRACCSQKFFTKCLACDQSSSDTKGDECFVCATSLEALFLCCFMGGQSSKISCCPHPFSCYAIEDQCCCLFCKVSVPCNSAVPFELGCCGVYCVENIEKIKEFEASEAAKSNDNVRSSEKIAQLVYRGHICVDCAAFWIVRCALLVFVAS